MEKPTPISDPQTVKSVSQLIGIGVLTDSEQVTLGGASLIERPAQLIGHARIRNCRIGAFSYFNGDLGAAAYDAIIGRFCSISGAIGPPDHPVDWFSTHPFVFMRSALVARYKQMPDLMRWMPDGTESYAYERIAETRIGHDCWIGTGAVIKRGVTIGDGAVIGSGAMVIRDVPPFAVVVGSPARVVRLRFSEAIIERLLKLQWWFYDIAEHKHLVDYSKVEQTLEVLESFRNEGRLGPFNPDCYRVTRQPDGYRVERQAHSIFNPGVNQ